MLTKRTFHPLAFAAVLSASLGLVGLTPNPTPGPGNTHGQPEGWKIDPGPIVPQGGGPRGTHARISGSFKLTRDPGGVNSKSGGGCLVFQPTDDPKPCQDASTCPLLGVGVWSYCIPGANGSSCWVKKAESDCQKFPGGMEENKIYDLPASSSPEGTDALPLGPSRPVAWRVVTCQNVKPGGCANATGKEGEDRVTRYGNPKN